MYVKYVSKEEKDEPKTTRATTKNLHYLKIITYVITYRRHKIKINK
jgi:hypothetical protein